VVLLMATALPLRSKRRTSSRCHVLDRRGGRTGYPFGNVPASAGVM
jgi:hypothetical protein